MILKLEFSAEDEVVGDLGLQRLVGGDAGCGAVAADGGVELAPSVAAGAAALDVQLPQFDWLWELTWW